MVAGIGRRHSISDDSSNLATNSRSKKSRVRDDQDIGYCFPQRKYLTLQSDTLCLGIHHAGGTRQGCSPSPVSGILESFTCFCLGDASAINRNNELRHDDSGELGHDGSTGSQTAIVYPIAKYNARLNSKKLVDQRLKVFQHHFFKPVTADERPRM